MWPYWLMFLVPAAAALLESAPSPRSPPRRRRPWSVGTISAAVAITLLVGFRYEVGGDWGAYVRHFEEIESHPLDEVIGLTDPGYVLLNWLSASLGLGIFGVNFVCGAIFAIALILFCKSLPRPWLALTVAVPYLLIVVAMGYSRQGVALAFELLALLALKNRSMVRFAIWGLLAATFHKSAVLLLPVAALMGSRNRALSVILGVGTTALGYFVLLQDSFDQMYVNYVDAEVQSQGALVRLMMNAVPAIVLLRYSARFKFPEGERRLWRAFAFLSIAFLGGLFFSGASTALDRIALYMLPLQLVAFSHLPNVIGRPSGRNLPLVIAVIGYYTTVLFTWLNFANNSFYWQPYRFYPAQLLFG